jgi:hypothetical protein
MGGEFFDRKPSRNGMWRREQAEKAGFSGIRT